MKNFIKKYWTHIFNISSLVYLTFLFILFTNVVKNENPENPPTYFIALLIIEIIAVLGIWAEIIYFMVKAAKNKELKNKGLHIAGIYFLNFFYIPCFSLSHIHKDSKAKVKNIIYVIVTVCLFVAFSTNLLKFQDSLTSYEKYISKDNVISVTVPEDYKNNVMVGEFDMYFRKDATFNIGVFLYDNTEEDADEIIKFQENYFSKTRDNFEVLDRETLKKDGKNITSIVCKAKYNGTQNYYYISTVTFDKKTNYVVCAIGVSLEDNREKNKKEFDDFINKIQLNQK
ncbi:MAG: hypothetical protein E7313_04995 [Clostridiales bacterium]|nr:hypothetical protein [Clostridiales bacterium]